MWLDPCHGQQKRRSPLGHPNTYGALASCKHLGEPDIKALEVELGGGAVQAQLHKHVDKVTKLCAALSSLEDVRAELSLLRVSANASRIAHLLRAAGPTLPTEALQEFDRMQRAVLCDIFGGHVSDRMWRQATAPCSGWGGRDAADS